MTDSEIKTHETFVLPASVVTKVDVSRLVAEVERIDNELTATAVRDRVGVEGQIQTMLSDPLSDFLQQNTLVFEQSQERARIIKELRRLKDSVPIIHLTFAVPADRESLQELAQWTRESVHPQAVISVGLQPALVAGVYVRTPNHVHDFSLRAVLAGKRGSLVKELETLRVGR